MLINIVIYVFGSWASLGMIAGIQWEIYDRYFGEKYHDLSFSERLREFPVHGHVFAFTIYGPFGFFKKYREKICSKCFG